MSTTDLSHPDSLWAASAPPPPPAEPLRGTEKADVVIVGGGFTGLSAALHLAEAGGSVRVLEAAEIGHGGSGRNAGLVNAGLWLPPEDVFARLGRERGQRLIDALGAAPDLVYGLVEKHGMACEATRAGTLHLAHAPSGLAGLQRRAEQWKAQGAPVSLLNRERTQALTGTSVFHGALLDERAGTIQPLAYAHGLAHAAAAAGVALHVQSPVLSLTRETGDWIARTAQGRVMAGQAILATNAYTDKLWPGLQRTIYPIHYFQFATEPLGDNLRRTILPEGHGAWDTGAVMHSLRMDAAGRLILGSMGNFSDNGPGFLQRWANKAIGRIFPELWPGGGESPRWRHAWAGRIAFTPDHLPRLHRLAPGVFTAIGYNGRGIGPGTVFGKALAEAVANGESVTPPLDFTEPRAVSMGSLRGRLFDGGAKLFHLGRWLRPG